MADQEAASRSDAIGKSAPQPEKPYAISAIKGLIGQFNDTLDALGGQDLPDVTWEPPQGTGAKWDAPLPVEIYAPLVALKEAIAAIGEPGAKYEIDCEAMVNDTEVRKVTAVLSKMEKDKKLAEAMQAPLPQAAPAAPPEAPPPSQFGEDDEALMGAG